MGEWRKVAWMVGITAILLFLGGCFESDSVDYEADEDRERDLPVIVPHADKDEAVSDSDVTEEIGEDAEMDATDGDEEEESGGCIDPGDGDEEDTETDEADLEEGEDIEPPCDCTEGPCCSDGCHFDPVQTECLAQADSELGCPDNPLQDGEEGCGRDLYIRYRPRFCSGTSALCEGDFGPYAEWNVHEDCSSLERCDPVQDACVGDRPTCDETYCTDGECCNLETFTLKPQGEPCGEILGVNTEYRCSGTACGADLQAREYTLTCTGTSALCEGEPVAGEYELVQDCTSLQRCDLDQRSCVEVPVCANDFCDEDAPCCDTVAQRIRGADSICEFDVDSRIVCSGDACGADLMSQTAARRCSGVSTACDGDLLWSDPGTYRRCDLLETCDAVAVECVPDRPRCDPFYCDEGLCCDTASQTMEPLGVGCRWEEFYRYDCSEETCGATLSRQWVERQWVCMGDSADCNSPMQESLGDWYEFQTCEANEICLPDDEDHCQQSDECAVTPCPDDMVDMGTVCIDRYEASRQDATETSEGVDDSVATSRPGVLPWNVNPVGLADVQTFGLACTAAGKRMCTAEEWYAGCTGSQGNIYVFGNTFNRETCNCVDTFCDDFCEDNGISQEDCYLSSNCGYRCGEVGGTQFQCLHLMPTGSFPDCVNEYGAYDISGNVWEIVPVTTDIDSRGFMVRGGAYNCAGASARLQCTYNAGWTALYAGFRCCKDRESTP